MTNGRRLVYNLLNLPYHRQIEIFLKLGLVDHVDINTLGDMEVARLAFKRAKEKDKLVELRNLISASVLVPVYRD